MRSSTSPRLSGAEADDATTAYKPDELTISESAITDIIRYYTREAGVRNLEREISKICRKVVKNLLLKPRDKQVNVTPRNLDDYLGVRRFRYGRAEEHDQVGQVTGLAWTEVGGELLTIEATVVPGKGKLIHTGQLGGVMQESIQAAMTVVRSRAAAAGYRRRTSIRNSMCISMCRRAPRRKMAPAPASACVRHGISTYQDTGACRCGHDGRDHPAWRSAAHRRLKEKLLAAHRGGLSIVLIPQENDQGSGGDSQEHQGRTRYPAGTLDR